MNIFAVHGITSTLRLLRIYKRVRFSHPRAKVYKGPSETEKLALFVGLAQGPQRSDVRLAFLHNIGVDDRRAKVEFELGQNADAPLSTTVYVIQRGRKTHL